MNRQISKAQARRFILSKHGLLGPAKFQGREGVLRFVRQTGCIQYDPVDVCGKSHELALWTRIDGFSKDLLFSLLYEERSLIDYWDKNMSILPTEDWPYFESTRAYYRIHSRSKEAVEGVAEQIRQYLHTHGHASSQQLPMDEKVDWSWNATALSRAALETMYFRGELVIHHKRNAIKSYALAEECLPQSVLQAGNPCATQCDLQRWQALRRIGAVGLLWNKSSDAWLGIPGFKLKQREDVCASLVQRNEILPVQVEDIEPVLYFRSEDAVLLDDCKDAFSWQKEVRFLPPLDCMLWDRKLIKALFDFSYTWEIYTPPEKRQYGYYVLPVLYGESFAGRVEPMCDRKRGVLAMRRFWPEKGFQVTKAFWREVEKQAQRLCHFHDLEKVEWADNFWS